MLDLASKYWKWSRDWQENSGRRKLYRKYKIKAFGKSQNEEPSKRVDALFERCIESGVVESVPGNYKCKAKFGNGWTVEFWTANKMYGYAMPSWSNFTNSEGLLVKFDGPPSLYMCYFIEEKIEKFQNPT